MRRRPHCRFISNPSFTPATARCSATRPSCVVAVRCSPPRRVSSRLPNSSAGSTTSGWRFAPRSPRCWQPAPARRPRSSSTFTSEVHADLLTIATEPLLPFASQIVLRSPSDRHSPATGSSTRIQHRLRDCGYRIAIDDLGEGYAGLTSLVRVNPDIVKIDMSLVTHTTAPSNRTSFRRSPDWRGPNGILVVAEGVETPAERATFGNWGVICCGLSVRGSRAAVRRTPRRVRRLILARVPRSLRHARIQFRRWRASRVPTIPS